MIRRTLSLCLCLMLFAGAAVADLPKVPSRYTFSMAYSRLQDALKRDLPVHWRATVSSEAPQSTDGAIASAMAASLHSLELSGVVQAYKEGGGRFEAAISSSGKEVGTLGHMAKDGRVGLNLNGAKISTAQGTEAETDAMLMMDGYASALMGVDYQGLRSGDIPLLTPINAYATRLWQLASPYCVDNGRLRATSGATSHGNTYTIDTAALRSILSLWADELSREGMYVGLPGTDMTFGVSQEAFDAFVARTRAFAQSVEVVSPIKINMALGEGDVMTNAKGGGTLQQNGKRSNVSYSYNCSLSGTRITRKYNVDFQPREGDTLKLTLTELTSSNNTKSGAHEINLDASGIFDGKPYRIKVKSEMVNKFQLDDRGNLSEIITGTATIEIKYDNKVVADITLHRNSDSTSALGKQALRITDTYDTTVKNNGGTLFRGLISLDFSVKEGQSDEALLSVEQPIESLDFLEVEALRTPMAGAVEAVRGLLQSLPIAALASHNGAQ